MGKIQVCTTVDSELLELIKENGVKISYLIAIGWTAHQNPTAQAQRIKDLENCTEKLMSSVRFLKHRLADLEDNDNVLDEKNDN